MQSPWRIDLFGGITLRMEERVVERFQTAKTGALLAFLAWKGRPVPRESLIDLLWPDADLDAGRNRLRVALNSLRKQLEPPGVPSGAVLVADRAQVSLNPAAYETDVVQMEAALEAERTAATDDGRIAHLERAVRLYRGELLAGLYDEWILPERTRLADACVGALKRLTRLLAQAHQYEAALEHARRAVAMDPLAEGAQRTLMRLYARTGRKGAAARQYHELTRLLQEELGARPSAATRKLGKKLARGAREGPPRQGGTAREEAPPEVLPAPAPPPPPAPPSSARPSAGIPLQFTRFFGREDVVDRVCGLLPGGGRAAGALVTLSGPGGMGKTRVAVECAQRLREVWDERVWFVSMPEGEARDPLEALAGVLRVGPAPGGLTAELVADALVVAPSLVVLDDVPVLGEGSVAWLEGLRRQVPTLACLVTARRRLDLEGETEIPVRPLTLPQGSEAARDLATVSSVALFVDRAQAVRPDFQITPGNAAAVSGLCRRLEGIPLALELAAAWAQVLTPAQMLERLSDRFGLLVSRKRARHERHQSLRAAIESSYALLSPEQQAAFVRLSVFRGGWTLAAAEHVGAAADTLVGLDELRQHAMVAVEETPEGMRFHLLDSLREFAEERLPDEARRALRALHAGHYLDLATARGAELCGVRAQAALAWFEREHDNLDRALAWWVEQVDAPRALALCGALWRFWLSRGHLSEGAAWLRRALGLQGADAAPSRLAALEALGRLSLGQGDRLGAYEHFRACLPMARAQDVETARRALLNAGIAAGELGDHEAACGHFAELVEMSSEAEAPWGRARALDAWGRAEVARGRPEAAVRALEEGLALRGALGDRWGSADILLTLGTLAYPGAVGRHAEGTGLFATLEDDYGVGATCLNIGSLAAEQGDLPLARELLETALETFHELRDPWYEALSRECLADVVWRQGEGDTARLQAAEAGALRRELGDDVGVARVLRGLSRGGTPVEAAGTA